MRRRWYAKGLTVVLAAVYIGTLTGCTAKESAVTQVSSETSDSEQAQETTAQENTLSAADATDPSVVAVSGKGFAIKQISGATYVNGILIANKTYSLPSSYAPGDITDEVKAAFAKMQQAAAKEGLNIYISSGYRSYNSQNTIYNNYVSKDGKVQADTYSARPGYSEHQTGLCFDLNTIDDSFANTPESAWLEKHAQEYGFIIRYPKGKEALTGYQYEPWHLRYLGVDLATSVYNSGLCLEEYLGITSQYAN